MDAGFIVTDKRWKEKDADKAHIEKRGTKLDPVCKRELLIPHFYLAAHISMQHGFIHLHTTLLQNLRVCRLL